MTTTTQTTLPLNVLRIDDKANVRKIGRGADADFIASIKAIGIQMPLIVRKNGQGYVIADGGKRFEAAQALVKTGDMKADAPVKVIDATGLSDAEAREISLALNLVRSDMHPVDAYRAFTALHTDKEKPLDVDAIATRFGIDTKTVQQRLALGSLHDKVLNAYRDGILNADGVKAFTLCDRKAQERIFDKLAKQKNFSVWRIKDELKIGNNNPGRLLAVIGQEAYEKRGGKVTRDLFGSDHIVSNAKLLAAMVNEKLDETIKQLVADGWSFAMPERDVQNRYAYGMIQGKAKPTKEEQAELDRLEKIAEDEDDQYTIAQQAAARAAASRIEAQIEARGFTAEQKAKAGCFVSISDDGIEIDYGKVKPEEKKKVEAQERKANGTTKKKVERKGDNGISNALVQRLSEQLTAATSTAIVKEPSLAMAALLAGFASEDKTVSVTERGLRQKRSTTFRNKPGFLGIFTDMAKKSPAELQAALAQVAAAALDFQTFNSERPPLKNGGVGALCNALNGTTLNKAIRAAFDAKDYFNAVSRGVIVNAVTEAMGAEHAAKVGKMKKAEAAKFALANVPGTGWLPSQLRTAHYDGPQKKASAPKKAAKKPAAKKKPATKR